MSSTLLDGVNEVLKRASIIDADGGELTTLTDSARQVWIDCAIQCWNEVVDELFTLTEQPKPTRFAEGTITLVAGTRAYSLSTASRVYFPFREDTNGYRIEEYTGGYQQLVDSQLVPANYTGRPLWACIRPTDGKLYCDRIPDSGDAGLVYTYGYETDAGLAAAADTFPFSDSVFRALVPAVTAFWSRDQKRNYDSEVASLSFARAARLLRLTPARTSWLPTSFRSTPAGFMNPFGD